MYKQNSVKSIGKRGAGVFGLILRIRPNRHGMIFAVYQKKTKRTILIGIIAAVPTIKTINTVHEKIQDIKEKKEIKKQNINIAQMLEQKYDLSDMTAFEKLYQDALPFMQLSMFPTECLVLNPYSDNMKDVSNTIGLGSFWFPKNNDPKSTEWENVQHISKLQKLIIFQPKQHLICAMDGFDIVKAGVFIKKCKLYSNRPV